MDSIISGRFNPIPAIILNQAEAGHCCPVFDPEFGDFSYAICIGNRLDPLILASISGGPTTEYYAHYRSMNAELASLSSGISVELNHLGIETRNIEPSVTNDQMDTIYEKTLRTSFSHKWPEPAPVWAGSERPTCL